MKNNKYYLNGKKDTEVVAKLVKTTESDLEQKYPKTEEKKKNIFRKNNLFSEEVKQNRLIINEKVGENYIDSVLTSGKIIRWNPSSFPLTVYIENNSNLPSYYYQQIRKAFERWQDISGNYITFKYTDIKDEADIRCLFPAKIERKCGISNVAAWNNFKIEKNFLKYSEITFAKVSCQNSLYTAETIYTTALHEIGHALGISGHSSNSKDLMYPVSSKENDISENDLRTLRLIYSIIPDVTNIAFSDNDKEGLITPDNIWGSEDDRIEMQLRDLKSKVKNVSQTSYSEYVKMGNLYYTKGNYKNAIDNYNKALEIATDNKNIGAINSKIATVYAKQKNYNEAFRYAEIAYNINPDENLAVYIANLHYELRHYAEAKSMMRNLLNRNPKVYNAYKVLCNVYIKEKDYKSAMALYERAKRHFPDNPPLKLSN